MVIIAEVLPPEKDIKELDNYPTINKGNRFQKQKIQTPNHVELIKTLKDNEELPCIFFVFSRKACQDKAGELARKVDFTTSEQKKEIIQYYNVLRTIKQQKLNIILLQILSFLRM